MAWWLPPRAVQCTYMYFGGHTCQISLAHRDPRQATCARASNVVTPSLWSARGGSQLNEYLASAVALWLYGRAEPSTSWTSVARASFARDARPAPDPGERVPDDAAGFGCAHVGRPPASRTRAVLRDTKHQKAAPEHCQRHKSISAAPKLPLHAPRAPTRPPSACGHLAPIARGTKLFPLAQNLGRWQP